MCTIVMDHIRDIGIKVLCLYQNVTRIHCTPLSCTICVPYASRFWFDRLRMTVVDDLERACVKFDLLTCFWGFADRKSQCNDLFPLK